MPEVMVDIQAEKREIMDKLKEFTERTNPKNMKYIDSVRTALDIILSETVVYSDLTPRFAADMYQGFCTALYNTFGRMEGISDPEREMIIYSIKTRVGSILSLAIHGKALIAKVQMTQVHITQQTQQQRV